MFLIKLKRFSAATASAAAVVQSKNLTKVAGCTFKVQFSFPRSFLGLLNYSTTSIGGKGDLNTQSTTAMNLNNNNPSAKFSVKVSNLSLDVDEQKLRAFLTEHNIALQGIRIESSTRYREEENFGLLYYDSLEAARAAISAINSLRKTFDQSQCRYLKACLEGEGNLNNDESGREGTTYVPLSEQELDWIGGKLCSRPLPPAESFTVQSAFKAAQAELRAAELDNCGCLLQTAVEKAVEEFARHNRLVNAKGHVDQRDVIRFLSREYGEERLDIAFSCTNRINTYFGPPTVNELEWASEGVHYLIHRLEYLTRLWGPDALQQDFERNCAARRN